ncbi:hypothetical protein A9762_11225 [Pandoraea sp. ISTKB]|nr:hypothetical protein A9762_11225 [Pandoraea sp. ISTKB]
MARGARIRSGVEHDIDNGHQPTRVGLDIDLIWIRATNAGAFQLIDEKGSYGRFDLRDGFRQGKSERFQMDDILDVRQGNGA